MNPQSFWDQQRDRYQRALEVEKPFLDGSNGGVGRRYKVEGAGSSGLECGEREMPRMWGGITPPPGLSGLSGLATGK